MPHKYTSKGAEMPVSEFVIPDGEYTLQVKGVKEGISKNGDYQVTCKLVVCEGERKGFPINYHRVTFIHPSSNPKAAGMSIHWLKTLGQAWEGDFSIEPNKWIGKEFIAFLEAEEYNGRKNMKLKRVQPIVETATQPELDEVPF